MCNAQMMQMRDCAIRVRNSFAQLSLSLLIRNETYVKSVRSFRQSFAATPDEEARVKLEESLDDEFPPSVVRNNSMRRKKKAIRTCQLKAGTFAYSVSWKNGLRRMESEKTGKNARSFAIAQSPQEGICIGKRHRPLRFESS